MTEKLYEVQIKVLMSVHVPANIQILATGVLTRIWKIPKIDASDILSQTQPTSTLMLKYFYCFF